MSFLEAAEVVWVTLTIFGVVYQAKQYRDAAEDHRVVRKLYTPTDAIHIIAGGYLFDEKILLSIQLIFSLIGAAAISTPSPGRRDVALFSIFFVIILILAESLLVWMSYHRRQIRLRVRRNAFNLMFPLRDDARASRHMLARNEVTMDEPTGQHGPAYPVLYGLAVSLTIVSFALIIIQGAGVTNLGLPPLLDRWLPVVTSIIAFSMGFLPRVNKPPDDRRIGMD